MRAQKITSLFAKFTLIGVYLVILAGSVVRMTGSGMGCPDWPKCFGQWIPPTDVAQLPDDYETAFLEERKEKLDHYIVLIESLGMRDVADAMRQDPSLLETEPFDARGTWIEYVNRLFGFLSGNAMLVMFIASLWLLRKDPWTTTLSFIALVAISFQAWLGSVVVATNLLPWTVTIHMIVAFLIIGILIVIMRRSSSEEEGTKLEVRWALLLALILTLIQVVLGTQVRQEIDEVSRMLVDRWVWIVQLGNSIYVHRSFSILLLLVNGYFIWKNIKSHKRTALLTLMTILLAEIFVGVILFYAGMPALAQPLHLLLATFLFGVQAYLWTYSRQTSIS